MVKLLEELDEQMKKILRAVGQTVIKHKEWIEELVVELESSSFAKGVLNTCIFLIFSLNQLNIVIWQGTL